MAQNTIPVISSIPALAQWQAGLRQTLKIAAAPPVPANFTIISKQGGNYLQWAKMRDADGYQVEVSENGDFAAVLTNVQLPGNDSVTYFDTVPTSGNTSRQQARILAVLNEPRLPIPNVRKSFWSFFGDIQVSRISPKNSTSFCLRIGFPLWE
jgi:hypothetical protein